MKQLLIFAGLLVAVLFTTAPTANAQCYRRGPGGFCRIDGYSGYDFFVQVCLQGWGDQEWPQARPNL
jgi:hypothetical protein